MPGANSAAGKDSGAGGALVRDEVVLFAEAAVDLVFCVRREESVIFVSGCTAECLSRLHPVNTTANSANANMTYFITIYPLWFPYRNFVFRSSDFTITGYFIGVVICKEKRMDNVCLEEYHRLPGDGGLRC